MAILKVKSSTISWKDRKWCPPEWREQISLAGWLDQHRELRSCYFHTPNGGFRKKKGGYWLRLQGVKPGVPDLIIIKACVFRGRQYVSMALELKRAFGYSVSKAQKHWLQNFDDTQFLSVLARSHGAAIDIINEAYPMGYPDVLVVGNTKARKEAARNILMNPKWVGLSDRCVARYVGVDHVTVSKVRASLVAPDAIQNAA